ncbi:hypothetical protein F7725_009137 [Dissostichus mawsoni]|uniref:Kynureninase n=1 Tax=Dissostichus mawsoni TaxID=36200 RepID=A0A7J5ZAC9_DISMA|nr:hypothetical protein F7725_009137 [Dissostichus mawsoni]
MINLMLNTERSKSIPTAEGTLSGSVCGEDALLLLQTIILIKAIQSPPTELPFAPCFTLKSSVSAGAVMDQFVGLTPRETVEKVSCSLGCSPASAEVAAHLDKQDPLRALRGEFLLPTVNGSQECIYMVGNSLGLQPKKARKYLEEELENWAKMGVHGHVLGPRPWAWAENTIEELMANVVGAKTEEVALMNGLTYAVESQIRLRGFDPQKSMLLISPRPGEETLRTEDIVRRIEEEGDSIAVGCFVGFDCAHAAGNVELKLHDWGVDFACWCSYRLVGWWGHDLKTRFRMNNVLDLQPGVSGFRLSNQPILLVCPLQASLEVFNMTSMQELRRKSLLLTGYLEFLILHYFREDASQPHKAHVRIITPSDPQQRGCQLSLCFSVPIRTVFQEMEKRGVACDMREPSVLRIAPVPLYNSFTDVHRFIETLRDALTASST